MTARVRAELVYWRAVLAEKSYLIRPYDLVADRRRWAWQRPARCGIAGLGEAPGVVAAVRALQQAGEHDAVDHPRHYTSHPSGVECIQVTEHMGFNLGNALKYIWRADLKGDAVEDLRKAAWYLEREIQRRDGPNS